MNRLSVRLCFLVIFMMLSAVRGEMRPFQLPDGRVLEAEVVSYNSRLGLVELRRTDGKTVAVKPQVFVQKDQSYIQQWIARNAFLSERILRVTCRDDVVKKWKEEETRDINYTSGTVEKDFIHNVIKYEETLFQFELQNSGDTAIEGLEIEYCIYYEQSTMVWEVKPTPEKKTFHGRIAVPALPPGGSAAVQTKTVMTYEDDVNPIPLRDGDQRRGGKGEIIGIRARLRMKGNKTGAFREVTMPRTLSDEEYPWTVKSSSNTRKKYRKKAR